MQQALNQPVGHAALAPVGPALTIATSSRGRLLRYQSRFDIDASLLRKTMTVTIALASVIIAAQTMRCNRGMLDTSHQQNALMRWWSSQSIISWT